MDLVMNRDGTMKFVDSSDYLGDFDSRILKRTEKRAMARDLSCKDAAKLAGYGAMGFEIPSFLKTAVSNVQTAVSSGISQLATNAINFGVSQLTPRDDAAAAAQTAAQQAALELERQKAVTAQQQAQAALAQAQAAAVKAQSGGFVAQYKTPLMIGGGVLALLVGLKVAKVI